MIAGFMFGETISLQNILGGVLVMGGLMVLSSGK